MKPLGAIEHPSGSGRYIPLYAESGFFNTLEGWNLHAKCVKEGNMEPYYAARDAYNARMAAQKPFKRKKKVMQA